MALQSISVSNLTIHICFSAYNNNKKNLAFYYTLELVFHEIVKYQGPLMVWSLTEMDDKANMKTKSNKKDLNFEGQKCTLALVLSISG